jgi:hypothetical protein
MTYAATTGASASAAIAKRIGRPLAYRGARVLGSRRGAVSAIAASCGPRPVEPTHRIAASAANVYHWTM